MSNCNEWMHKLNNKIGDKPLKDIVIPGSHDAGSWDLTIKILDAASKCQEVDIKSQLLAGSRYLDLRAEYRDNDWYMVHGGVAMNTRLEEVINQLKWFLDHYPLEIITLTILGPSPSQCKDLMKSLLNNAVTPEDEKKHNKNFSQFTPNELASINKNLIPIDFSGKLIDLKNGQTSDTVMNREGIYYDDLFWSPEIGFNFFKERYENTNKNNLWIYHINLPFYTIVTGTPLNPGITNIGLKLISQRVKECYSEKIEKINETYSLNIINIDFITDFGWIDFITELNLRN